MKVRYAKIGMILLMTGLLIVGLIALNGCKKSEPPSPQTPAETMQDMQAHEHMAMKAEQAVTSASEQTTCPVMGGAINKAIFIEYQGKKVYFCCPGCEEKFKAEPEKYIAKLPQFKN